MVNTEVIHDLLVLLGVQLGWQEDVVVGTVGEGRVLVGTVAKGGVLVPGLAAPRLCVAGAELPAQAPGQVDTGAPGRHPLVDTGPPGRHPLSSRLSALPLSGPRSDYLHLALTHWQLFTFSMLHTCPCHCCGVILWGHCCGVTVAGSLLWGPCCGVTVVGSLMWGHCCGAPVVGLVVSEPVPVVGLFVSEPVTVVGSVVSAPLHRRRGVSGQCRQRWSVAGLLVERGRTLGSSPGDHRADTTQLPLDQTGRTNQPLCYTISFLLLHLSLLEVLKRNID